MRKLLALCLLWCALSLTACANKIPAPVIITNDVPDGLLSCPARPAPPVWQCNPPAQCTEKQMKADAQAEAGHIARLQNWGLACEKNLSLARKILKKE